MTTLADRIAKLPPLRNPDDALSRSLQFASLSMPGQPQFMHMGTSYLVSDLASNLRAALARLELLREGAARAANDCTDIAIDIDLLTPDQLKEQLCAVRDDLRALLAATEPKP